ncbi:MAG: PhzF family phenazine biosynthesis protein [Clostridia bacterium]|nr:PhzF family phenazine biosynthesis protein [Clostridia bacterium]
MKFYIVDAFTDKVFGGNPAGVVYIPEGADFPDDETMRKTAAELRYSETAFLKTLGDKKFHVRYFTPAAEVDLCGHATIATFYTLFASGAIKAGDVCDFKTMAGDLTVLVTESGVLMDMGEAQAFGTIEAPEKLEELYRIMGAEVVVPEKDGQKLYPELVSTGLTDIMMAVKDMDALNGLEPNMKALSDLSKAYDVTGVHAFTVNTTDGNVHCRNFAPLYDIDEEAATGTSNGALTYYLYKRGFVTPGKDNIFIQGEAMDRPSIITSRLTELGEGKIKIQVGGVAAILAEGEINL